MAHIVVANAGTHPEPMHLAAGIRRSGHKVSYWTASSVRPDGILARIAHSRVGRRLHLVGLIRRRVLPASLSGVAVRRFAARQELVYQFLVRRRAASADAALKTRTARFRERAARALAASADIDCVVAQQTSAYDLFAAAPRATRKILMYPIAHHRWMDRYLGEEARMNPGWASFLQGNDRSSSELKILDREIEMADLVIVASTFVKDTFVEQGVPEAKLRIAPLGASVEGLFGSDGEEVPSGSFKVLFAGQITQRKGVSYLIDGFRRASIPGSTLTFVGRPIGGIERVIPTDQSIRMLPARGRDQLGKLYQSADVLVLPSLAEGFGLVAMEAMVCGTPCIITDKTFAYDVIVQGVDGFVIPARDAEALADKLRALASDPKLARSMGEAARVKASRFTWARYEEHAASLSAELLGA